MLHTYALCIEVFGIGIAIGDDVGYAGVFNHYGEFLAGSGFAFAKECSDSVAVSAIADVGVLERGSICGQFGNNGSIAVNLVSGVSEQGIFYHSGVAQVIEVEDEAVVGAVADGEVSSGIGQSEVVASPFAGGGCYALERAEYGCGAITVKRS